MDNYKIINKVFADIENGKFDRANSILSDNFKATILGKEVNKPVYISAYRALLRGFPDLRLHIQQVKVNGNRARAKLKLTGTNSQKIPALMKGWREIPATFKKVDGLMADLEITLNSDQIEEIKNVDHSKGLFAGLIEKLGMDVRKLQEN